MARFAEVTYLSDTPHAKNLTLTGRREETGERVKVKVKAIVSRVSQRCCAGLLLPDLAVEQSKVAMNHD